MSFPAINFVPAVSASALRTFHIQKHTKVHFFVAEETLFPLVKGGMGESAPSAKFFYCHAVREI